MNKGRWGFTRCRDFPAVKRMSLWIASRSWAAWAWAVLCERFWRAVKISEKREVSFSSDEGERLTAGKSCSLCGGGGWSGNTRRTREHFSPQLAPRNLGGVKMERKGRVNHRRTNKIYYIYLSFRVWGLSLHFTEYPRQPALPNHLVPDLLLSPLTLPPDFLISRYLDFSFSKSF